jgi:hypothetical protein
MGTAKGMESQTELSIDQRKELGAMIADPVSFASQILGVTLWSAEVEMLRSIENNRRTAIKACYGGQELWSSDSDALVAGALGERLSPDDGTSIQRSEVAGAAFEVRRPLAYRLFGKAKSEAAASSHGVATISAAFAKKAGANCLQTLRSVRPWHQQIRLWLRHSLDPIVAALCAHGLARNPRPLRGLGYRRSSRQQVCRRFLLGG